MLETMEESEKKRLKINHIHTSHSHTTIIRSDNLFSGCYDRDDADDDNDDGNAKAFVAHDDDDDDDDDHGYENGKNITIMIMMPSMESPFSTDQLLHTCYGWSYFSNPFVQHDVIHTYA